VLLHGGRCLQLIEGTRGNTANRQDVETMLKLVVSNIDTFASDIVPSRFYVAILIYYSFNRVNEDRFSYCKRRKKIFVLTVSVAK
jgi:hypothetical protein